MKEVGGPEPTVAVSYAHSDPLAQRTIRPDAGFLADCGARTIELLFVLRSVAFGRHAVYLWSALLLAAMGAMASVAWRASGQPRGSVADTLRCVAGQTSILQGRDWLPADTVPPGVSAASSGPERNQTVVALGHTTIRFTGPSLFTWRRLPDGTLLVCVNDGHAWFDLQEAAQIVVPGAHLEAPYGAITEVNLDPGLPAARVIRCRGGSLHATLTVPGGTVVSDLQPPQGIVVQADGTATQAGSFGPDTPWQTWNRGLHPNLERVGTRP